MKLFAFLVCVIFSSGSLAIERMYGVVSTGYSDVEFNQRAEESFGYKILLGHQFHRQWYVETGYLKIADVGNEQTTENDFLKADGLYLGALGKASSPVGELFYRIGVARIDVVALRLPMLRVTVLWAVWFRYPMAVDIVVMIRAYSQECWGWALIWPWPKNCLSESMETIYADVTGSI